MLGKIFITVLLRFVLVKNGPGLGVIHRSGSELRVGFLPVLNSFYLIGQGMKTPRDLGGSLFQFLIRSEAVLL